MNDTHIVSGFDRDLESVQANIMKMGGLVEAQIDKAITALREGEPSAVADVEKTDEKVNKMEMQNHEAKPHCHKFGSNQP